MTKAQAFLAQTGAVLFLVTFLGLIARAKYVRWWFFSAYIGVASTASVLIAFWPERFWTPNFWLLQETLTNMLRFGAVLELAFRTFQYFPGALSTLRWAVLLVLTMTLVQLLSVRLPENLNLAGLLSQQHTPVLNGSVWLVTVIAAFILWYRLPISSFHKRVLLSWVPYLLVFTVATKALTQAGWLRDSLTYARQVAFSLLGCYWAYLAWRPEKTVIASGGLAPAPSVSRPHPA